MPQLWSTRCPDGVVVAGRDRRASTRGQRRRRADARRRPGRRRSAGRWPRCSPSRTRTAATGSRPTARTTAWPPGPPSPSSPGCCPTAPRCWSPPGSTGRRWTEPVERVAVSLRSGRGRARLDRERSDLVATVAHELRSPLTGVKGFVQALLNRWDKLNDEQKKLMLTTVSADSDRLSRLIAELLDVARIDTGRLQLYPRPVRRRRAGAPGRRSVARRHQPPDRARRRRRTCREICADPDKFTQVVTNLVENGVRHGEGTVRVTRARRPAERRRPSGVASSSTTRARGSPPELRRRVFTKFWTGGARGGSGLGLYIVNGLVRAHGGTVTIDDAPGGGARIVVDLAGRRRPTTPEHRAEPGSRRRAAS